MGPVVLSVRAAQPEVSTRISGRRTAPFHHSLLITRVLHGFVGLKRVKSGRRVEQDAAFVRIGRAVVAVWRDEARHGAVDEHEVPQALFRRGRVRASTRILG